MATSLFLGVACVVVAVALLAGGVTAQDGIVALEEDFEGQRNCFMTKFAPRKVCMRVCFSESGWQQRRTISSHSFFSSSSSSSSSSSM